MTPAGLPRPRSITIIGWLFVAVGVVGLPGAMFHHGKSGDWTDVAVAGLSACVALSGGVGLLRGLRVARWILLAWLAFHVALCSLHAIGAGLFHAGLLVVIGWFLFRASATAFLRARSQR